MSSSDVRAILNLPQAGQAGPSQPPRRSVPVKKPEGISRELYALIGDNAPSLAEAQASLAAFKYRERPKLKSKAVKWEWMRFTPVGKDGLGLGHWVRSDEEPDARVEYFGKFNLHGPSVMQYSQFEYDQHLVDPTWTSQETAYLFGLLREYDLRFVVVADRYEYAGKKRSIEEIKDRYYTICRRLVRTRTASDPQTQQQLLQAYAFDKARETKRKQYASELFHLTAAEIAEEEALYVEIKRMEQNERRYRADRDDLMRTVVGLDSGLIGLEQANGEGVVGLDKNKKRKREEEVPTPAPTKKQKESAAYDLAHCIYRLPTAPSSATSSHLATRHPLHVGVHLRSTKLPQPKPNAAIRITDLLGEMGVSTQKLVMPTRVNLEVFERVLQAAGGLVDMKRQVDRVEQEVRTLRAQREGYVPPTRQSRSMSVVSEASTRRK